jgi:hypothetical protein
MSLQDSTEVIILLALANDSLDSKDHLLHRPRFEQLAHDPVTN